MVSVGVDLGGSGSRVMMEQNGRRHVVTGVARIGDYADHIISSLQHAARECRTSWDGDREPWMSIGIGAAGIASLEPDPVTTLARIEAAFPGVPTVLAADCVTAHAGALGGASGTVIAVGTGAIALSTDFGHRWHRADGWGHLLGDRGSGAWIGLAAVRAALKAVDGTWPQAAAIRDALEERLGPAHTWPARFQEPTRNHLLASLAPTVAALAASDPVAAGIRDHAVRELVSTLSAAHREGIPLRFSATGGLLHTGIGELLGSELKRLHPDAEWISAQADPLEGAAILGRVHHTHRLHSQPGLLWV